MKMIIKPMYFVFSVLLLLTSCNNEELFVEDTAITEPTPETPTTGTDDAGVPERVTTPCDFTLEAVQANATVIINCVMDLGGKTITLPAGVTLVYEGGDIVNGTIKFANNTTISGELLNSSLTITGASPLMKDPVFEFKPSRWGIVEGVTTSTIAQRNNNILEATMIAVKNMGVNSFKIDKMDAYFEVSKVTSTTTNQNFYASSEAINVPSNFNLIMTDNTVLRVQPNSRKEYSLLAVREVANVTITGGKLYGDRDEHDYSSGGTHEWGYLIDLHAAVNTVVDGVKLYNATGDGIDIHSLRFTYQPDYSPAHDIIVKNCYLEANRRSNISITDGYNIIIENNEFVNAGIATSKSTGAYPRLAFNVEAHREKDANGNFIYYEKAYDIIVRNNKERGSDNGGFGLTIGEKITVENNIMENNIALSLVSDCMIKNNVLTSSPASYTKPAITFGGFNSSTVFGNTIKDNTINNYENGMGIYDTGVIVTGNKINNCQFGIFLKEARDMEISNNIITSNTFESRGLIGHITWIKNVTFSNNTINVKAEPYYLIMLNQESGQGNYTFTIKDNNSNCARGAELDRISGAIFTNNTLISTGSDGIKIQPGCSNISINTNNIDVPANYQCIKNSSSGSNISIGTNTCI